MNRSKDSADLTFCPQGELTIYTAQQQKAQLLLAMANQSSIHIDLSGVTDIDTAGLQLLILARLESLRRSIPLNISGHTKVVLEIFELCNLSGFFGDPVYIPSNNNDKGALS